MKARRSTIVRALAVVVTLLGVTLVAVGPILFKPEWPKGHEGARYALLLIHFRDALRHGQLSPRWLPNAYSGYGYPTFVFYQPGFFYLSTLFSGLPGFPWSALAGTVTFLFLIGGVGAFLLSKELSGWTTGLFCAALFLITPYLYVNLYVRGDLSELMATLICPWPLFFLARLGRRVGSGGRIAGPLAGAALSLALVVISHPLTALFLFPAFCLIALYVSFGLACGKRGTYLGGTATAVALGAGLSAPYWLAAVQMKQAVTLERAFVAPFVPVLHLVSISQLFSNAWGFGVSVPGDRDDMSFQLGLPHFVLATLGVCCWPSGRFVRGAYAVYLGLIILTTSYAKIVWDSLPSLYVVQFPWRILSVTATLQLICCTGLHHLPQSRLFWRRLLPPVFLAASAYWYSDQFSNRMPFDINSMTKYQNAKTLYDREHFSSTDEFLPRTARPDLMTYPRGRLELLMLDGMGEVIPLTGNSAYHLRYRVSCEAPRAATIRQWYFPGWMVKVDGRSIPSSTLESWIGREGLIRVMLEPGRHTIEAYYEGPPGWELRNTLSILSLCVLGGLFLCERVRSHYQRDPSFGSGRS